MPDNILAFFIFHEFSPLTSWISLIFRKFGSALFWLHIWSKYRGFWDSGGPKVQKSTIEGTKNAIEKL